MTSPEMLREVSARELAGILHVSPRAAVRAIQEIPEARKTDGGHNRVPLWAVEAWQRNRGQK
jgi:hypothetical protein